MPLGNGTKFAGYTIERRLGAGGMGEVYLVQHPRLPRHDALKVLRSDLSSDPSYMERFNREADLASKLWHPHIVGIHDRGQYRGKLWISMDYVEGTDAAQLLQQHPTGMPKQDALDIARAVAAALDYAHGMGLLHRDVKPANILVAQDDERILLADFGIARDLDDDGMTGLTATNMTVGTTAYAAPEQLMGLEVGGRADQYSLAATLYHLLTGTQLFAHTNPAVVIGQHLKTSPPALGDTRADLASLDAALARALSKEPDDRFASCLEFVRALEVPVPAPTVAAASLNDVDTLMAPVTPPVARVAPPVSPQPVEVSPSRNWLPFALAVTVILAVAGLVGYLLLKPVPEAPRADPFNLTGTVRLPTSALKTKGLPAGYQCAGAQGFGDIGPDAAIVVEDESGTLLAKGSVVGSTTKDDECLLKFTVSDVPPGSKFYRVQVGEHPQMNFTEDEAKAGVELLMANTSEPTTPAAAPKPAPTRTVTVAPTPDASQQSLVRLRTIAGEDRSYVAALLADRWIPQISSKRVGLVAKGIVWDNDSILNEHLRLRSTYPDVKLLWSGDWSTYDGPNFWVTVVGLTTSDPYVVLNWCTQQGFDRDNCIAKLVSTTHPIAGSTKLNP